MELLFYQATLLTKEATQADFPLTSVTIFLCNCLYPKPYLILAPYNPYPGWPPQGWVPRADMPGWWCNPGPCRRSTYQQCYYLRCYWHTACRRRIVIPCEGLGRCSGNCASCTPWNRCTDRVRARQALTQG